MRILFIIDSLTLGGKERRLVQLMKGLKSVPGIEFILVLMGEDINYKEVFDLDIKIHYILKRSKKDLSPFYRFYQLCKNWKPDIVHCWESMTAVYIVPACKLLKIKIVNGMVTETLVKQNIFDTQWLRSRLTFPFSDVIVGNSVSGLSSYKAPGNKSVCIYNGMALSRFEHLKEPSIMQKEIFGNIPDDIFVVGMVAEFAIRKDYRTLIKAAIVLSSSFQNIRFILVGDGADFNTIKESVPVSLSDKIFFTGRRSDVESIINIFDVGVLLTNSKVHAEGVSNSIIEYMALGKPVIATRGGGTNEVVIDNQNGFLIDPGNADQLAEKISTLIENRSLMDKFGKRGKQLAREKFNLDIMTNRYISLYNELIKNN